MRSHRPSTRRRLLALLAACGACLDAGLEDDGWDSPSTVVQPVRCAPRIDRYPIAAPHNGGYDGNWSNFTCAPHPGHSPDNSDYGGAHHGNDLFAPRGAPVVAPRDGVVTRSGVASSTSGNRVTIEDECGWGYYLGHLDAIAPGVGVGARVRAGQVIGAVGNTGAAGTAPHVHFNVHRDGDYNNDTDPFPLLQAADATACGMRCAPHCEGSTLVGGDCGRGDCAPFGSRCVNDSLGARCAFAFCPDRGEVDVCWATSHVGHCRNGALTSQGDCAVYGAICSTAGAPGGRCVSVFCVASAAEVPRAHDVCLPDGRLARCDANGGVENARACPAGSTCRNVSGAGRCEAPRPTDAGAPDAARPDAARPDADGPDAPPDDGAATPSDAAPSLPDVPSFFDERPADDDVTLPPTGDADDGKGDCEGCDASRSDMALDGGCACRASLPARGDRGALAGMALLGVTLAARPRRRASGARAS